MRPVLKALLATALLSAAAAPATAAPRDLYEVAGVAQDDMLKMRAGPGTGYIVLLGLPNGTQLRVRDCTQTGGTRWCEVALNGARNVKGFVSWAYLRKL